MNINYNFSYLTIAFGILFFIQSLNIRSSERDTYGRLTLEKGLAGETVTKVIRDCGGLTWIATSNGVSMFNGEECITIDIVSPSASHKANRHVFDICEVQDDHSIYISTSDGIFRLKPGDNYFTLALPDMGKCHLLSLGSTLFISNTKGLHLYDGKHLRDINMNGEPNVRAMTLDNNGTLHVLTTDALCRYAEKENKLLRHKISELFPSGVSFSAIAKIGMTFYIGTKNYGLFRYSEKEGVRRVQGVGNVVNSIVADSQGNVCVSTDGSGAYLVDGKNGVVKESFKASPSTDERASGELSLLQLSQARRMKAEPTDGIDTDAIYYYIRDPYGGDWFCQSHFGLVYTYYNNGLFKNYRHGHFTTDNMAVRSFLLDGRRKLIGTLNGLYVVDEASGMVYHIGSDMLGGGNIVTGIERMGKNYYIGTYDGGLHRLDIATLRVSRVESFDNLKCEGTINQMRKSPDGRLWIGTNTGIVSIDPTERAAIITSDNSGIREGSVNSITFATDGSKWFGGARGLSVMSADGSFINNQSYPMAFFNDEHYLMGCCSAEGQIYMGNRQGVFRTDPKMSDFGKLKIPDGIIDETCNAIYCDTDSGLWLTSEKGLFRICLNGKRLIHFGYGMGIMSQHFLRGDIVSHGDTLWVTSPDGLKYMSLRQMWQYARRCPNRILLYDILRAGNRLSLSEARTANINGHLQLMWNFTSEQLFAKAVLNDYAKPHSRIFEYKVDEEEEWHLFRNNSCLFVSGLAPGNHKLTVRLAGISGSETTYTISVVPSFAFIVETLLVVLCVILIISWHRYQRRTHTLLSERNAMADALMEIEEEVESIREEQEEQAENNQDEEGHSSDGTVKYEKLKIPAEECQQIVECMARYITDNHAYRNPELKRSDIAQKIHVPAVKLSYVFTQYLNINYYDYVNQYRLAEFKRLIAEGEYQRYTIQALSERCGFKKSSFFNTFRKVEGMTPTEYLRQQKVNVNI